MGRINASLGFIILSFMLEINCDVVIKTESGEIAGLEVESKLTNGKYYSFMGIPYAQPPVGELRFMPPLPHEGWTETLEATSEKVACPQLFMPIRKVKNYGLFGSEDCLHLSVHTPELPHENGQNEMPVIVFIYNEQLKMSHNNTKDYLPDFFMEENVIIVYLSHRLSSLGFVSFEDDIIPGNNALRDIILALKWIKNNIHQFGGDYNRVTLMGSVGGGVLVDTLLQSSKAKGLFHSAILQSGTTWNSIHFNEEPRKHAIKLSENLEWGAITSPVFKKNLNRFSALEIINAEGDIVHADDPRSIQKGIHSFGITIEHDHPDAIITELPEKADLNIDVPVMIGYNSREGIELSERLLEKPQYLSFADRDFLVVLPIRTGFHFRINDNIYYDAVEEIKKFYFDEGYVKVSKPGEYITYIGDIMQFYSTDYAVRKYANVSKSPVYYYLFDYSGDLNMFKKRSLRSAINFDGTWGASVTDELCYLFVCNPIKKTYLKALQEEDSEEIKVLKNMVKLWTNFAKNGNPTPDDSLGVKWEPVTPDSKNCLVISDELQLKKDLFKGRVRFWDKFIEKYKEMAVDGLVKDAPRTEL